jgi:hypothetical protein
VQEEKEVNISIEYKIIFWATYIWDPQQISQIDYYKRWSEYLFVKGKPRRYYILDNIVLNKQGLRFH